MKASVADAFRLAVDDAGLAIEFGRSRADAASIALTDRIEISRALAQRLLLGLREALTRQARATPAADDAAQPADALAGPSGLGALPMNLPADPAAEAAARLLGLVRDLGVPYQYERSFRLAPGSLQANRFLTSLNRADLGPQAWDRTLAVARAMGMPEAAQAAMAPPFAQAHCLHFGFEAGPAGMLAKLYAERKVPPDEAAEAAAAGRPVLLHLAAKWPLDGGPAVLSHYDWYPGLSPQGIAARLQALYGAAADSPAAAIAAEALALAGARDATLQYLEVHEPDNGRRSFDINLYDAGLQVRDLLPLLLRMRDLYAIRPGQFQALVDQIRNRPLGHLAGGLHRDGRDFFNVYYGVVGFPQFASALG